MLLLKFLTHHKITIHSIWVSLIHLKVLRLTVKCQQCLGLSDIYLQIYIHVPVLLYICTSVTFIRISRIYIHVCMHCHDRLCCMLCVLYVCNVLYKYIPIFIKYIYIYLYL